jgi:hypothetical protein
LEGENIFASRAGLQMNKTNFWIPDQGFRGGDSEKRRFGVKNYFVGYNFAEKSKKEKKCE